MGLFLTGLITALVGIPLDSDAYVMTMGFLLSVVSLLPISILYLYIPEVNPTEVRTMGFGVCMLGHRLAPVIAPFAVAALDDNGEFWVTSLVFGGLFWAAGLISLTLRVETWGKKLIEVEDLSPRVSDEDQLASEAMDPEQLRVFLKKL